MNPENLENVNQIDMDCNFVDDDDNMIVIKKSANTKVAIINDNETEESNYNRNTGVVIDLSDDENIKLPKKGFVPFNDESELRTLSADIDDYGMIHTSRNYESDFNDIPEDPNAIDMECTCGDYDDDFGGTDYKTRPDFEFESEEHTNGNHLKSSKAKTILDFNDDPEFFHNELVSEEMLEEKKKVTQGEVEKDYWDKIQKKHAASNKKGAMEMNFHFSGNPKAEAEMFNHDMRIGKISNITNSNETRTDCASFAGEATTATGSGSTGAEASAAGGCCESLETNNILKDIFTIIGFDVIKNSDGSYIAIDLCDDDKSIECINKEDLMNELKPYIDDCFLYPLQIKTGENFTDYRDWVNWYKNEENKQNYPKCAEDISYLDFIVNHLNEYNF